MKDLKKRKVAEMIRVNHAGEMGAKLIYQGQITAFKLKNDHQSIRLVKHMKEQEDEHFNYFNKKMQDNQIRPTIMQPIWQLGGFALGFLTAAIDKKAAMTCTTAVEEVIDEHYMDQIKYLEEQKNMNLDDMKEKIIKFREEEIEHRDIGYKNDANKFSIHNPLSKFIKATTKIAIIISKKI